MDLHRFHFNGNGSDHDEDLVKNVFQVHGVDEEGRVGGKKQLRRAQVAEFFANLSPCLVGIEACSGAHHWARGLEALGYTVRLMAPQFVKPYVRANKADAADAEATCEALTRPGMRFVPIKSVDSQTLLALHRARQGFIKSRVAQTNKPDPRTPRRVRNRGPARGSEH